MFSLQLVAMMVPGRQWQKSVPEGKYQKIYGQGLHIHFTSCWCEFVFFRGSCNKTISLQISEGV